MNQHGAGLVNTELTLIQSCEHSRVQLGRNATLQLRWRKKKKKSEIVAELELPGRFSAPLTNKIEVQDKTYSQSLCYC